MRAKYSLIVPAYNEEPNLHHFYERIIPILEKTEEPFEIIFVNDGSRDGTESVLNELASKDSRVKPIHFSRNFGQYAALIAGFQHAEGDAVIDIDADLQDPPEAILDMIAKWKEGYDIVHGKRLKRNGESFFRKSAAFLYYRFVRKATGLDIPKDTGDFKLFDRKAIDVICALPEKNRFLRGQTAWIGFKQTTVEFVRNERFAGETKYNAKKLVKLAGNSIVSNSNAPLSISLILGLAGLFLSFAAFLTFIILCLCNVTLPLTAWLFPSLALCTSGLLTANGLTNVYVGRIFDEVKDRPLYIVREKRNFKD